MWCKWCRENVPEKRSATSGAIDCAHCGRPLSLAAATTTQTAAEEGLDLGAFRASTAAHGTYEEWELDQNVRRLQAKVGTWHRPDDARPELVPPQFMRPKRARRTASAPRYRRDPPHAKVSPRHKSKKRAAGRSSLLAWCLLFLGLMAFACGTALLVFSGLEQREDLWSLGMPIVIGGQVGLFLGLVLQLERIWQNGRDATRKLDRVDAQLHQLERTTSQLNVTHGSAAGAFYSHMAEDASPQLLLADLKGQLDLLAARMARRR